MAHVSVILLAAGKSSRFDNRHVKKPFVTLNDKPVWLHSAERFLNRNDVKQLIVVIAKEDREYFADRFAANIAFHGIQVVFGGQQRSQSVKAGLEKVSDECTLVAIHDAARPCVADQWIDQVLAAATRHGAALLATRLTSTLKRSEDGESISATMDRTNLWLAQTPQVFDKQLLLNAIQAAGDSYEPTDDAQWVERIGHAVKIVECSPLNIKITTREDLQFASAALKVLPKPSLDNAIHPLGNEKLW